MKKQLYTMIVVLAFAALGMAQMTPGGSATPPPSEVPQASAPDQAGPGPEASQQKDRDRDKAQASVSNQQLEKQVRDQLATRPEFANVTAEVKGGTVVLNGTVSSKEERTEAVNMVKSIQGVHKVKDRLKVGAGASSGSASNNNPANAGVSSGSQAEAPSASGSIAGNTTAASGATAAGSSGATSGTAPAASSQVNEADLNQAIQQANISNVHVIANQQGQVILSGAVATAADRDKVVQIVQQRAPSAQIINNLVITEQGMPAATTGTGGVGGTAASTSGTGATAPSASGSIGAQTGAAGASAGVGAQTGAAGTSGSIGASASPSAGATTGASTGATGMTGASDTNQLQSQIQGAIQNEPTLSGSNVNVNVTDTAIELSGTVPTGKEKQTAKRIAQSYAGNRKVVDRLTVTGRGNGANANPSGAAAGSSSSTPMSEQNPATGTNPATNPSANPNANPPSTVPQSQPQSQPQSTPQTTPQPQSDQSVPQTTPHN